MFDFGPTICNNVFFFLMLFVFQPSICSELQALAKLDTQPPHIHSTLQLSWIGSCLSRGSAEGDPFPGLPDLQASPPWLYLVRLCEGWWLCSTNACDLHQYEISNTNSDCKNFEMLNVVLICAQMKHSLDLRWVRKVTFWVPLNNSARLIFVCLFLSYQSASVIAHTFCSHLVLSLLRMIFEKIQWSTTLFISNYLTATKTNEQQNPSLFVSLTPLLHLLLSNYVLTVLSTVSCYTITALWHLSMAVAIPL